MYFGYRNLKAGVFCLLAAALLVVTGTELAEAQTPAGSIQGTVLAESGEPLADAMVLIQGTADTARTDAQGGFRFAEVAPGRVTLSTRYVGRTPQQMTVPVMAGQTAQVTLRLRGAVQIEGIVVTAAPSDHVEVKPIQLLTLPTTASLTMTQARQTVNIVDAEDAVKYMPSVMMRKRNNGDVMSVMGTRIWGIGGSARSLIFADGLPLSTLIGNNNTFASPKWGLVSPIEIARVDMMNGPYSAAYAGNSMGAVMEISTRLPTHREATFAQTASFQTHDLYGTKDTYGTLQTSASVGDRWGKLAIWFSGNYQDSHSQPIGYVTSTTFPSGTTGGFAATNKLGAAANILGATGLLHTQMTNAKIKLVYDLTSSLHAAYTFGVFRNETVSAVQSYLTDGAGGPTFAGQAAFATGFYSLDQVHTSHGLSVRSDTRKDWDFDLGATYYDMNQDRQVTPTTSAAADTTYTTAGRVGFMNGTSWYTLDAKTAWHKGGVGAAHTVSFGAHIDRYQLVNPVYNTADRNVGATTTIATEGDGNTRTAALWSQDAWQISDVAKLTVGGRFEAFHSFGGFNQNGPTQVNQPSVSASRFSPKAVFDWSFAPQWTMTFSAAQAFRFPTATELYQLVTTGTTFTSPAPDLKPENVLAGEVRVQRKFGQAQAQVAFFGQDVHDAIISQFLPLVANSPTLYSYLSNVDHVRAGGIEVLAVHNHVLINGLQVNGYVTWLDARTLALSGRASATAPADAAIGKFLPNIPKWRAGFTTTYRPTSQWAFTWAGRYSSMLYTTLDNADVKNPNVYQGFTGWFVMDARANFTRGRMAFSFGVDNITNKTYFLFHPFPQRTFVGDLKFSI
jgi:iron complex outermembrane receptor protein